MSKTMQKQSKEEKGLGKKVDFDLGARVSERVEIQDVFMVSSNTYQSPDASRSELVCNISQSATTNLQEDNIITVLVSYKLDGKNKNSENEEIQLSIEARYMLVYTVEDIEGVTPDCVEAFGHTNGMYNAWPYWREFVQSTMQRMELPKAVLPVFRLGSSEKPVEKKTGQRKVKTKAKSK